MSDEPKSPQKESPQKESPQKESPQNELTRQIDDTSDAIETPQGADARFRPGHEPSQSDVEEAADAASATPSQTSPDAAKEAASEPAPQPAATVKSRGAGVAWFALLLTLGALGGVGYLYYELIHQDPATALAADLRADSAQELSSLQDQLGQIETGQRQDLDEALERFERRLRVSEEGMTQSLNRALSEGPPSQREWKLAEAAYLLRVANHRVLMEGDTRAAVPMLQAADQIMAELDDFSLHQVRAALADEILLLQRLRNADVQGVYLTIEAIKDQLAAMPVALPEYLVAEAEPAMVDDDTQFWQVIEQRFFSLFEFRRVNRTEVKPLLAPDEGVYLEQNIRLTLEQAQLAALKRHQAVFEASLGNAREWVQTYLDPESEDVVEFLRAIDDLLSVQLEADRPDISGSLNALQDAMRGAQ